MFYHVLHMHSTVACCGTVSCLSQAAVMFCCIKMAAWIKLIINTEATIGISCAVLCMSKMRVLPSGTVSHALKLSQVLQT